MRAQRPNSFVAARELLRITRKFYYRLMPKVLLISSDFYAPPAPARLVIIVRREESRLVSRFSLALYYLLWQILIYKYYQRLLYKKTPAKNALPKLDYWNLHFSLSLSASVYLFGVLKINTWLQYNTSIYFVSSIMSDASHEPALCFNQKIETPKTHDDSGKKFEGGLLCLNID